jgi:hypothetical protein
MVQLSSQLKKATLGSLLKIIVKYHLYNINETEWQHLSYYADISKTIVVNPQSR